MQICRTRVLVRSPSGAGQSARPRRCTRPTRSLAKCTPFVFRRVQTVQKAVTSLDLYTGQSYMGGQANSLSKRWVAGARWLGEPISGFCEAPDGTHGLCHRRHLGVGLPTRNIGVGFFPSSVFVTTSKALVTRSDALVTNSFLLLLREVKCHSYPQGATATSAFD